MIISLIVAAAKDNAIGRGNALPWNLPKDLKFFKTTTLGKPIVMGRKTFEALGKPLPGRLNIVISGNSDLNVPEGVLVYTDINTAISRLEQEQTEECFIIGGGKIFEQTMPLIDRMYITRIDATIPDADTFFPEIDHTHWKLVWDEKHTKDEKHEFDFAFQQFDRIEM
jgi:dihydrofolate reductase